MDTTNTNEEVSKAIDKVTNLVKDKITNNKKNEDQVFKLKIDHYNGLVVFGLAQETYEDDLFGNKKEKQLHQEIIVTGDVEAAIKSVFDSIR